MSESFWLDKELQQMTEHEWESLCDGCGRCCLLKLQDEETGELHFTNVNCHLLNTQSCRCNDYINRKFRVPECLRLRTMSLEEYQWLPESCAYRRLAEGKSLPQWHPLISGDANSVVEAGISIRGMSVSEDYIHPEQLVEHIIILSAD